MKSLQVEVKLLSPLQLGSGKADVILDSEAGMTDMVCRIFPVNALRAFCTKVL